MDDEIDLDIKDAYEQGFTDGARNANRREIDVYITRKKMREAFHADTEYAYSYIAKIERILVGYYLGLGKSQTAAREIFRALYWDYIAYDKADEFIKEVDADRAMRNRIARDKDNTRYVNIEAPKE